MLQTHREKDEEKKFSLFEFDVKANEFNHRVDWFKEDIWLGEYPDILDPLSHPTTQNASNL